MNAIEELKEIKLKENCLIPVSDMILLAKEVEYQVNNKKNKLLLWLIFYYFNIKS